MFNKLTIRDAEIKNQIVLVRVDYNVPLENGQIVSDLRIRASLPTITYLMEHEAQKIILISHLGRPDGRHEPSLTLAPVADKLRDLLPESHIDFVNDVSGSNVESAVKHLPKGGILLLENLRFYPGEEANSSEFIGQIVDSTAATMFVQDGFAVVHRAHASTSAIADKLPIYAGLLLEKEISTLSTLTENPDRPLTVIMGGAKVAEKQPLIDKFLDIADQIIVGGKIAADGYVATNDKIYVSEDFDTDSEGHKLDMGPISAAHVIELLTNSRTVLWNGLLGKAEDPAYATSSTIVAKYLGEHPEITSVICGGDTTGFVEELQSEFPDLTYSLISTGGGAALEFLSGKTLPGLEVIKHR